MLIEHPSTCPFILSIRCVKARTASGLRSATTSGALISVAVSTVFRFRVKRWFADVNTLSACAAASLRILSLDLKNSIPSERTKIGMASNSSPRLNLAERCLLIMFFTGHPPCSSHSLPHATGYPAIRPLSRPAAGCHQPVVHLRSHGNRCRTMSVHCS